MGAEVAALLKDWYGIDEGEHRVGRGDAEKEKEEGEREREREGKRRRGRGYRGEAVGIDLFTPRVLMTCTHCLVPHVTLEDCRQALLHPQSLGTLHCSNDTEKGKEGDTPEMKINDLAPDLLLFYAPERSKFLLSENEDVFLPQTRTTVRTPVNSMQEANYIRKDNKGKEIENNRVRLERSTVAPLNTKTENRSIIENRLDIWVLR